MFQQGSFPYFVSCMITMDYITAPVRSQVDIFQPLPLSSAMSDALYPAGVGLRQIAYTHQPMLHLSMAHEPMGVYGNAILQFRLFSGVVGLRGKVGSKGRAHPVVYVHHIITDLV